MKKKLISMFLIIALILFGSSAVFADESGTGFIDINSDAWYAEAVSYVQENNLMDDFSADEFSPNIPASRITLAVALYRAENSPAISSPIAFSDVEDGTEYSNAV